MSFVGVTHLTTIGEELKDGVDICGRFFECSDIWDRFIALAFAMILAPTVWEKTKIVH